MTHRDKRANLWAGVYAGLFGTDADAGEDVTDDRSTER